MASCDNCVQNADCPTNNDEVASDNISNPHVVANLSNGDATKSDIQTSTGDTAPIAPAVQSGTETESNVSAPCCLETRKVARAKKRDTDQALKMLLNAHETSEAKLEALCKKYAELADEHKQLKNKYKQLEKQLSLIMREKDQLQTEHSKAVLAKSKLESLCRELHRHNEQIKQESLTRAKEEEEKRKEVTGRFQTTITEIQQQMNEHYTKNAHLREENNDLAAKLKNLIEQYEIREQQIEKLFKHKDLEQQLNETKLAQINLQMAEEKERNLTEKQKLLEDAAEAQRKIVVLESEDKQLRAQVALYTEKYEEFQGTLQKSNDVFQSFKVEMDKMTKKIKNLEKETSLWKAKCDTSTKERNQKEQEVVVLQKKLQKLESLCRALQEERRTKPPQESTKSTTENSDGVASEIKETAKVVETDVGSQAEGNETNATSSDAASTPVITSDADVAHNGTAGENGKIADDEIASKLLAAAT